MNSYALLDVVRANVRVGECDDSRPCIVVGILLNDEYLIMPCSSQLDLYRKGIDFLIPKANADFIPSGLTNESYVINEDIFKSNLQKFLNDMGGYKESLRTNLRPGFMDMIICPSLATCDILN